MPTASLVKATFGDELSQRDVTKSIQTRLNASEEQIPVDSALLPYVQVGGEVKLSDSEQQDIKDEAEKQCGNANDANCIELKKQEIARQRLAEKENQKTSTANIVKGRRLTVQINEGGKIKTFVIPEGQNWKPKDGGITYTPAPVKKGEIPTIKTSDYLPSAGGVVAQIMVIGTTIVMSFLYAFSILATWRVFMLNGFNNWIGYVATAISVIVPYSGIFITLAFFGILEYRKVQKVMTPQK